MRYLKILGATIIAILALSAIASATASAAEPEFLPGAAGTKITGTSGSGTLEVEGQQPVECEKDTVTGEIIGATKKEATATIDFSGCKAFGFIGAHSLGDKEGVILVKAALLLCFIKKGTPLEVGVLTKIVEPVHIEVFGKLITVSGDAVGKITPLKTSTKNYELVYKSKSDKQEPDGCENAKGELEKENYKASVNEGSSVNAGESTTEKSEFSIAQTLDG